MALVFGEGKKLLNKGYLVLKPEGEEIMKHHAHKCRPNIVDGKCSVCGRDEKLIPTDYINPNPKKVSRKELLKALKEVNDKNEAQRRADNQAVSDALNSGFYCTGGRSNIKPLI